eukprot:g5243.t1
MMIASPLLVVESSKADVLREEVAKLPVLPQIVDIEKREINNLEQIVYPKCDATVICTAAEANRAVSEIRRLVASGSCNMVDGVSVLGFDTETKPNFVSGQQNSIALVQIATSDERAFLFRTCRKHLNGLPSSLVELLSDPSILKIGVGIAGDVRGLQKLCADVKDGGSFCDLTPLAKMRWPNLKKCGLRNMSATILRGRLAKSQQMKNWEMPSMTHAMIRYAATDAVVAIHLLHQILRKGVPAAQESKPGQQMVDLGLPLCSPAGIIGPERLCFVGRGSITKFTGDAIVNAANERMLGGGGVDGAVSRAGGKQLLEARRKLPIVDGGKARCLTGRAVTTISGNLPCKFVIHSVGPDFRKLGVSTESLGLLRLAYKSVMVEAETHNVRSLCFSLLSSGAYRGTLPLRDCLKIAIETVIDNFYENLTVIFCAFTTQEENTLLELFSTLLESRQ